jgi:hypothetical protein
METSALHLPVGLALSLFCGFLLVNAGRPEAAIWAAATAGLIVVALDAYGPTGIACLLVAIVPLIPVVHPSTLGPVNIYGVDASNVRIAAVAGLALLGIAALTAGSAKDRENGQRKTVGALLALSLVGVAVAAYNGGDFSGGRDGFSLWQLLPQAAGQPFIYAALLLLFVGVLNDDPSAKRKLFIAWAVAVLVEAVIVTGQFATGNAYDALRGITRGEGTMGANFLGAFALFGLFGAMHLREIATSQFSRRLATTSVVAAGAMMIASVSRGALVGFGLALVALLTMRDKQARIGKRLVVVLVLAVVVGGSLNFMSALWSERLATPTTREFDRPASWISGIRITKDNPLAGVGPLNVASAVNSIDRYSDTPYGVTGSNPHNTWIFAFAAGGLLYGGLLLIATSLFVCALWGRPKQRGDEYLKAGLLGVGFVFIVNNLFTHPEIMIFVLFVGALIVVGPKAQVRSQEAG